MDRDLGQWLQDGFVWVRDVSLNIDESGAFRDMMIGAAPIALLLAWLVVSLVLIFFRFQRRCTKTGLRFAAAFGLIALIGFLSPEIGLGVAFPALISGVVAPFAIWRGRLRRRTMIGSVVAFFCFSTGLSMAASFYAQSIYLGTIELEPGFVCPDIIRKTGLRKKIERPDGTFFNRDWYYLTNDLAITIVRPGADIIVPKNFASDLGSVPEALIEEFPPEQFGCAAVVHDFILARGLEAEFRKADLIFAAMLREVIPDLQNKSNMIFNSMIVLREIDSYKATDLIEDRMFFIDGAVVRNDDMMELGSVEWRDPEPRANFTSLLQNTIKNHRRKNASKPVDVQPQ